MSTSGFWTAKPKVDPARQFRFRINMKDAQGQRTFAWWAKTCDRPKINIPVLGKDEYYLGSDTPDVKPGEIIDFQPITMTFIDPVGPSTTTSIMKQLSAASGECFPRINGAKLKDAFGEVSITQIDAAGVMIESFVLRGAFPTSIDFGSLDYGSDEFVTITMTWEYRSFDYAAGKKAVITSQTPKAAKTVELLDGGFTVSL
tara:strand:+ start:403 stop:1005 length:603 start_codon:yes stop_codon:yes gene_type:complete